MFCFVPLAPSQMISNCTKLSGKFAQQKFKMHGICRENAFFFTVLIDACLSFYLIAKMFQLDLSKMLQLSLRIEIQEGRKGPSAP